MSPAVAVYPPRAARLVDTPAGPVLAGYAVTDGTLTEDDLRLALAARLPDYMVPAGLLLLDALPLTPGGKVDRAALPAPELGGLGAPPEGDCEEILAEVWQEVLGAVRVSRHDDFFSIGGHSLLATRLTARIRDTFDIEVPLRAVFGDRTLAAMARRIEDLLLADLDDELAALGNDAVGDDAVGEHAVGDTTMGDDA
ncbi:phosphopantetheine-binding protein [Kitasatospora sp. NPDC059722]|uniref:phosphopantetheine-binding protein n=1 Tax=Kitasatospora sp. NPDC059722 TaxID=3346925 RepID=UPI00368F2663